MTESAAPSGDRPLRGFDTFLAVLAVLVVNFVIGGIIGGVFGFFWAFTKHPGSPTEFLLTDFNTVVGMTTALNAITLVGLYAVGRRFSRHPFGYFFAKVPAATLAKAAASAIAMMALFLALEAALKYGWHISLNAAKTEQAMTPKSWNQLAIVLACFALFVPFYEEFLFRGFLFGWLKRKLPLWPAMAISAAIFALVHGLFITRGGLSGWIGTGEIFALGMLLAWWAARTGSLWPTYVVHLINNVGAFCIAFFAPNLI